MKSDRSEIHTIQPSVALEMPPDPRGLGGLIALAEKAEHPLPLQWVRVRAAIAGDCCRTVIEQRFRNNLEVAMEAVHVFPLPDEGAVIEMELLAGDVRVVAECRERAEAEETFERARGAGRRAGLLTKERADVHALRVTNLPPHTDVTVRIVVVERLQTIDGRTRWRFPTVIAPRFLPGRPIATSGPGALPDTDRAPDASRFTAFVAVGTSVTDDGERVEIVRPVELPEGWDPAFLTMALASPPSPYPKPQQMRDSIIGAPNFQSPRVAQKRRPPSRPRSPEAGDRGGDRATDLSGRLARLQGADGSYGGDVDRTAAALIALVLLGNTRRAGLRRRTAAKAAKWLSSHSQHPYASLSLEMLARAESGDIRVGLAARFAGLAAASEEGKLLAKVLAG